MEELKSVVASTLEKQGILAKLRAQLRAHVFAAIEAQEQENAGVIGTNTKSAPPTAGLDSQAIKRLATIQATPAGSLVLELIKEWLEFYELDYTASTLLAEARLPNSHATKDRQA